MRGVLRNWLSLVAAMIALPAWVTPAVLAAQVTTVAVRGVVSDSSRPIEGAHVEVRSRETGAGRSAMTDAAGRYQMLGFSPGSYEVIARAVGYRPARLTVELVLGAQPAIDFSLATGTLELDTVVTTARAGEAIERLDVSTVVGEREIERLPLDTRDVLALASIAPGIRSFAPRKGLAVPSAGAASAARFVNLYVDGTEWKGFATGSLVGQPQTGSLLPQEAIREFRVMLNPYDVEYTRGASWVISAITHQGSNQVEGSIFGFLQNRQLVARGAFEDGSPGYRRSQAGGNVRGPIVRGRMFYSLSYEQQITNDVIDVVPGRPSENPGIWDRYAGSFASPTDNRTGMLRLTAIGRRHTLNATWLTRHLSGEGSFGNRPLGTYVLSREAGARSYYRVNNIQLKDQYAPSRWLNELAVNVLYNSASDVPLQPGVTKRYRSIQTGRPVYPNIGTGRQIGVSDKISAPLHVAGDHLLKTGVELIRITGGSYVPSSRDGLFIFATDTSTRAATGQIGLGFLHPESDVDARATIDGWSVGGYVQDEWRPSPGVTVTAGLRYDADLNTLDQRSPTPWARDTVLQRVVGGRYLNSGDRVNDLDNLAPRVAVSWDVGGTGRTWIRAGHGVMYDRVPLFGAFFEKLSWTWRIYNIASPATTNAAALRDSVMKNGRSAPNLTLLPDRMETPSTRQWSTGMSHRITDRLTLSSDYLFQHMRHLPVTVKKNTLNAGRRPLTSTFGDISLWGSFGNATYRALLTSLNFDGDRTHWNAAYTLGKARSNFGTLTTSDFLDSATYRMQRSDGDERHRVVISAMTEVPYGIQFSLIGVAASPRPFSATIGSDVNRNGTGDDDFPNGIRTWRRGGWPFWYRTIDLRLARSFAVSRGRLVVSADAFNVANWANHSDYQPLQSLLNFAEPTGDYARRRGQIGMRYQF